MDREGRGRILRAAVAAAALAMLAAGLFLARRGPPPREPAGTGSPAGFTLRTPQGEPFSLRDVAGRPVLLVFWATWCPHCNAAVPDLNALRSDPAVPDLAILAVNYRESPEKVRSFVSARGVRYTVLLDPEGSAAAAYGVVGIPTYVLIDRRGRTVFRDNALPERPDRLLSAIRPARAPSWARASSWPRRSGSSAPARAPRTPARAASLPPPTGSPEA